MSVVPSPCGQWPASVLTASAWLPEPGGPRSVSLAVPPHLLLSAPAPFFLEPLQDWLWNRIPLCNAGVEFQTSRSAGHLPLAVPRHCPNCTPARLVVHCPRSGRRSDVQAGPLLFRARPGGGVPPSCLCTAPSARPAAIRPLPRALPAHPCPVPARGTAVSLGLWPRSWSGRASPPCPPPLFYPQSIRDDPVESTSGAAPVLPLLVLQEPQGLPASPRPRCLPLPGLQGSHALPLLPTLPAPHPLSSSALSRLSLEVTFPRSLPRPREAGSGVPSSERLSSRIVPVTFLTPPLGCKSPQGGDRVYCSLGIFSQYLARGRHSGFSQ